MVAMFAICDLLGVTTSGYYAWLNRSVSERRQYDLRLISAMKDVHQGFRRAYGAPRIHRTLVQRGFTCSVRRINRLMKEAGIKASTTGLYVWTPGLHAFYSSTGNPLKQAEPPDRPGQQWGADFSYIRMDSSWLYLAVVIDLYSRKVIGWAISRRRNAELTKDALRMALKTQRPLPGCICYSDQGIEYAAHEYGDLVEQAGMVRSMSRKGKPIDNAIVESFFGTLKAEHIQKKRFRNDIEATASLIDYIHFYNNDRLHSSLGFQSPDNYEKLCA